MDEEDPPPPKAKKARVRKTMPHVAVRLEPELVAEIDAVALELATQWRRASRSDALRLLLIEGLKAHKAKRAAPPKGDPDPET
jgi:hypothetical protein